MNESWQLLTQLAAIAGSTFVSHLDFNAIVFDIADHTSDDFAFVFASCGCTATPAARQAVCPV